MKQEVIDHIASLGFDVYMQDPSDTYLHFTDGVNIGYLQEARYGGFDLSTVHKPNTKSGTGFRVGDSISLEGLTAETLARAFIKYPSWASYPSSVVKYRDIEHFLGADQFNAKYKLVAKREGRD